MGVDGKKDHVPVPMDKLAMAKQMAAKLTAKTATINKSEVRPHKKSTHDHLYVTRTRQVEKTTEGFVRGTGGAPGQSFSAKSVAGELLNNSLNFILQYSPPRPTCRSVERQVELRARRGRRALVETCGGGWSLPEIRRGTRDQRLPPAGQVCENLTQKKLQLKQIRIRKYTDENCTGGR